MAKRASRGSARERITRLQAEAAVRLAEKAAPKAPKAPRAPRAAKAAAAKGRQVVVWLVVDAGYRPVARYPFKERQAAEDHAARLTAEKGAPHAVQQDKQPG